MSTERAKNVVATIPFGDVCNFRNVPFVLRKLGKKDDRFSKCPHKL